MRRRSVIALLAVLAACERYEDTGRACLLPHEMECHVGDSESDTGLEYHLCDLSFGCDCTGYYPANTAFDVHALMSSGGGGYTDKEKCRVEMDGDFQLSVKASYVQKPEQVAIVEPAAEATCTTPTLAAGDWTLRYGGGEVVFRVGDAEPQMMACAMAGR
jgi:hypothetical protein